MATLPISGTAISFGQVNRSYTNQTPGAAGDAPLGGQNIKLSAYLGATYANGVWPEDSTKPAGTAPISLSANFGGRTTPYS